jgi:hypothetical protein
MRWQPAQSKAGITRRGGLRDPFDSGFEEPEVSAPGSTPLPAANLVVPSSDSATPPATKATVPPVKSPNAASRPRPAQRGGHGNWLDDEIQPAAPARSGADDFDAPREPQRQQRIKTIIIAVIAAVIIIRVLVAMVRMAF